MRKSPMFRCVLSGAALAAVAATASPARANVLLYSFEPTDASGPLDGFARNGGGITPTAVQDGGATAGVGDLQLSTTGGFVGALSTVQGPLTTLDNPNVTGIQLDVTAVSAGAQTTFATLGFSLFVGNPTTGDFGEQYAPPTSDYVNIDFPAGTQKTGLTIPLVGNDPVTGSPESYAQLLAEGYVPTGFEIVVSETGGTPALITDVDNIQATGIGGAVPEPASLGLVAFGGLLVGGRRRRAAQRA